MNTTLFAACLARLGLSQVDAAELLEVKLQRIKDMGAGRSRVPAGIWQDLRRYEDRIAERAEALGSILDEASERAGNRPETIDAVVDDAVGLMALADFVLNHDVTPGEVQVGIVR